ncbi:MAG: metalloregulator ArsR/SmtB family transcription factor [Solirubrobacteraceae bacterium]
MPLTDAERDARAGLVFGALADPTRRQVVRLLVDQPSVTASALTTVLPMTRQAITKHLVGLAEAGLVSASRSGRETHYALTPAALTDAMAWMVSAGARWDDRLDRLEQELERRSAAR